MSDSREDRIQAIPWGREGSLEFELPPGWKLLGKYMPAELPPLADVQAALEEALTNPIGSRPLSELAASKSKVAIIIDDISRPTPTHLLIGRVLEHLIRAGVDLGSITLVAATGLHRLMHEQDMLRKVGREALVKVKWECHDSRNTTSQVFMGRTDRGTPVYINRTVAEADLRILIGGIRPHPHAGFGGGYKLILPGVAGVKSIAANHAICAHPRYFFMLGTDPAVNPMRQDLEQAGGMLKGETFLINTVLNARLEVAGIVSGDPISAHRQGIRLARQATAVSIPKQADVVISDSYPMDIDLRQGVKAVADVIFAARPGGIVIAALKCEEGLGNMRIPKLNLAGLPAIIWKPLVWMLSVVISKVAAPGTSPEERFSTYFMLKALLRNRIFIYAPSIASQAAGLLPGVSIFNDFQATVSAAGRIYPEAEVVIFPCGGASYPETEK